VNTFSRLIYDVDEAPGSVHDFTLCKTSLLMLAVCLTVLILADSGYQGIQDYHWWSLVPIKKSKGRELSAEEKAFNRELSRRRIVIENINAEIKVFKIMSCPYRNRRQSHLLRTKLVCAILNAEKAL
jgi:transposase